MTMNPNNNPLFAAVVFVVFAIPVTLFVFYDIAMDRATMAADIALAQQADAEYHGIKAKFTAGEYVNTAVATCWAGTVERRDYNKSRIIGGLVGQKSKEMAKGIVDGLKTPSKHKEQ